MKMMMMTFLLFLLLFLLFFFYSSLFLFFAVVVGRTIRFSCVASARRHRKSELDPGRLTRNQRPSLQFAPAHVSVAVSHA